MVTALAVVRVLLWAGTLVALSAAARSGEFKEAKWLPWALLFMALSAFF